MGVYIFMDILPNKIGKEEWKRVYEESLELIKAYPFMDSTVDSETYGVPWRYVHRPKEEEMETGYNEFYLGWHVFGDYKTMLAAESFSLFRNIESYHERKSANEDSDDILAELINQEVFHDQEKLRIPVSSMRVFDGKTQGFPHHTYLLAIACLIESRFPKQAAVRGDISIAQMKKAINWANTILQKTIQLTERADNEKLLYRIIDIVQDDVAALKSFMRLSMHEKDFALGEYIREQFSQEAITAYYIERFKEFDVNMAGFHDILGSFFNLGFSIEAACDICVLDPDGCRYDAKDFAETVLSRGWSDGESHANNDIPLTYNDPESEEPETVHSQFGKAMLKMAGFQEGLKSNLSYDDVGVILQSKLGHLVEIEPLIDHEKDKNDRHDDTLAELFSRLTEDVDDERSEYPEYSIDDPDYLIKWKKGATIHPRIEDGIKQLKDFVSEFINSNNDLFDEFHRYTNREKIQRLIKANTYFLIRKETWDYYIDNIDQTDMIDAVLCILGIKAEEININRFCKAAVNNIDLLKEYILNPNP